MMQMSPGMFFVSNKKEYTIILDILIKICKVWTTNTNIQPIKPSQTLPL